MADDMAEMDENFADLRRVACRSISGMKEKAAKMDREMRIKTRCMKAEMKKVDAKAYEFLSRERERVKH